MKRACWGTECRKAQLNEMTVSLQTAHPAKPWVAITGAGGVGGVGWGREGGAGHGAAGKRAGEESKLELPP